MRLSLFLNEVSFSQESAAQQMHALKKQIRAQEKKQDARMAEVKHMVRDLLKDQIYEHLKFAISLTDNCFRH